jgi:DNA sulfur modification protein DndD
MIFTQLSLTDFGLFRGSHNISLTPKPGRPVILFGGKNGAGKSTLFEAVRLCLYGQRAFGSPLSKDAYLSYLNSRIHSNPTLLIQPTIASVSLDFKYADAGQMHSYRVTRSWERRGMQKIQEHVEVTRNGKTLEEVSDEYWQDFVRDMVPPGISQLFFFDGEKIQHLAEDASDQASLADSIKALLGLDLIDRLQTDIGYFISRQIAPSLDKESSGEIQTLEQERDRLQTEIEQLRVRRGNLESKSVDQRSAIQRVEAKLTSCGGNFSRNRENLIQRKATTRSAITQHEAALRQLAGGMLPFALVPKLCQQVADQLCEEEAAANIEAGIKLLRVAKKKLIDRISDAPLWASLPASLRTKVRRQIIESINQPLELEAAKYNKAIHDISPIERRQILSWIQQAKTETPVFLRSIGTELEDLYRELSKIEVSLKKIPAEELIRPLVEELNHLHHQFSELDSEIKQIGQQIVTSEARLAEVNRIYQKQLTTLAERDSVKSRTRLASKVQSVLSDYQTALLEKKVLELQDAVTKSFNSLCRKKDSVRRVAIDPKDFSVTLFDKQGRPIPKSQLSAGEKQIYAVSMLWALGKISGRPLPIMIDTPLGRLDSDHRKLLVKEYFPAASHQVIILSTDTEIDQTYFSELKRAVTQAYSLEFDPAEYSTSISKGYWWSGNDETH